MKWRGVSLRCSNLSSNISKFIKKNNDYECSKCCTLGLHVCLVSLFHLIVPPQTVSSNDWRIFAHVFFFVFFFNIFKFWDCSKNGNVKRYRTKPKNIVFWSGQMKEGSFQQFPGGKTAWDEDVLGKLWYNFFH